MSWWKKTVLDILVQTFNRKSGFERSLNLRSAVWLIAKECTNLKVPKREIFDRSDFPDFYTMKSLRVGDFGVKIKFFKTNI